MEMVNEVLRDDILTQLARVNILGERFINVDGWEICLDEGGITAHSFSSDVFKFVLLDDLLNKIPNFNSLCKLLEFQNKNVLCILELDMANLPFEAYSGINIYNQLKRFKQIRYDVLLVLIVRNLKELKHEFNFSVYFDIIYLPDTQYISYSFNTNLKDLKLLIAPKLRNSCHNFQYLLNADLFLVYSFSCTMLKEVIDNNPNFSFVQYYRMCFNEFYFLDTWEEIREKINLLNSINMVKLIGDVFDDVKG